MSTVNVTIVQNEIVVNVSYTPPPPPPNVQLATIYKGDTGAQGPVGPGGGSFTGTAGQVISGHMALRWDDGGDLVYASSDDDDQYSGAYAGISLGAAQDDADVTYQTDGLVTLSGWAWAQGPVFVGLNGALTQTPPTTGILTMVGYSPTPTSIDLRAPFVVKRG